MTGCKLLELLHFEIFILCTYSRLYSGVGDVTDCDNLQFDLNAILLGIIQQHVF